MAIPNPKFFFGLFWVAPKTTTWGFFDIIDNVLPITQITELVQNLRQSFDRKKKYNTFIIIENQYM